MQQEVIDEAGEQQGEEAETPKTPAPKLDEKKASKYAQLISKLHARPYHLLYPLGKIKILVCDL